MKCTFPLIAAFAISTTCTAQVSRGDTADSILEESGVRGGLVVHLGCGTGELTAALCKNNAFLVHGLDRDAANVEVARRQLVDSRSHGSVTVEHWLPGATVVNAAYGVQAAELPDPVAGVPVEVVVPWRTRLAPVFKNWSLKDGDGD